MYAHLGDYNVLALQPPYTPEKYIEAIELCEKEGMEVIIIDSISHAWDELLDFHSKLAGNSFTNWSKVTPRQKAFTDKILQCKAHVIATMRTKQDYVLNQKDGKYVPEKVGLKAVQRDGLDYEFTLVFDIDIKHFAVSSKDRTGLFMGRPEFIINSGTGRRILEWCNSGVNDEVISENDVLGKISTCQTINELSKLYQQYPQFQQNLNSSFTTRKNELSLLINQQNIQQNGTFKHY